MPDRPRPALGLLIGLAVALLGGCGGSSAPRDTPSDESPSAASAARASFVAHAEAICSTLSAQEQPLRARQESLKRLPSAAVADTEFVALVRQLAVLGGNADGKLRALARPAGDAENIEKLLTSLSQQLTEVTDVANAAAKQESAVGETAVLELRRSIAENIALAERYGMKACVSSE